MEPVLHGLRLRDPLERDVGVVRLCRNQPNVMGWIAEVFVVDLESEHHSPESSKLLGVSAMGPGYPSEPSDRLHLRLLLVPFHVVRLRGAVLSRTVAHPLGQRGAAPTAGSGCPVKIRLPHRQEAHHQVSKARVSAYSGPGSIRSESVFTNTSRSPPARSWSLKAATNALPMPFRRSRAWTAASHEIFRGARVGTRQRQEADHRALGLRDETGLGTHGRRTLWDPLLHPEPNGKGRDDRIARDCVAVGVERDGSRLGLGRHGELPRPPRLGRSRASRTSPSASRRRRPRWTYSAPASWAASIAASTTARATPRLRNASSVSTCSTCASSPST